MDQIWTTETTPARVRQILAKTGYTQAQLAEELGITVVTVSRWCNGHYVPMILLQRCLERLETRDDE